MPVELKKFADEFRELARQMRVVAKRAENPSEALRSLGYEIDVSLPNCAGELLGKSLNAGVFPEHVATPALWNFWKNASGKLRERENAEADLIEDILQRYPEYETVVASISRAHSLVLWIMAIRCWLAPQNASRFPAEWPLLWQNYVKSDVSKPGGGRR